MKHRINKLLDWFEAHFNYIIELIAFLGGIFCILFAITMFVILLIDQETITDAALGIVLLPGLIGFFGVIILFALRITRHLTHE